MSNSDRKKRRWPRVLGALVLVLILGGCVLYANACTAMGASAEGARLTRMEASPQYKDGQFTNRRSTKPMSGWDSTKEFLFGGSDFRSPEKPIVTEARTRSDFDAPPKSGLRITWLGHSTFIVEIDGIRVLVDPVWGERASPLSFLGPQRYFPPPLPMSELPEIDAVVISHDHYDHLDYPTVLAMVGKKTPWIVPLGIGAHLEYWGMPKDQIVELDWWENKVIGQVTLTATPARHFSGRTAPGENGGPTLWCGWALIGNNHRTYYSGDTALFDELTEIGERLGPFDVTMIESGAYNDLWSDVHLGPEQAVRAHQLARGKLMMPVHWGLFDLALHGWTEPVERVLAAAKTAGVDVITPRPGQMYDVPPDARPAKWWPEVPWETAEQAPAISTGTEHLMTIAVPPIDLPPANRPETGETKSPGDNPAARAPGAPEVDPAATAPNVPSEPAIE